MGVTIGSMGVTPPCKSTCVKDLVIGNMICLLQMKTADKARGIFANGDQALFLTFGQSLATRLGINSIGHSNADWGLENQIVVLSTTRRTLAACNSVNSKSFMCSNSGF